jgi:hypothetical protein
MDNHKDEREIFLGFVDINNFKEIGLDFRNIMIETSCYFVYLTRSSKEAI